MGDQLHNDTLSPGREFFEVASNILRYVFYYNWLAGSQTGFLLG